MKLKPFFSMLSCVFLTIFVLSCQNNHTPTQNNHNNNNNNNNNHHNTTPEALYKMSFPGANAVFIAGSSGVQSSSKLEYTSADGQVKPVQFLGQDGKALNISQDRQIYVLNIGPDYLAVGFGQANAQKSSYTGAYLVNKKTGLCYKLSHFGPNDIVSWTIHPDNQYLQVGNYILLHSKNLFYCYDFSNPQALQVSSLNLGTNIRYLFPAGTISVKGKNHTLIAYEATLDHKFAYNLTDLNTRSTNSLAYYFISSKKGQFSYGLFVCYFYTDVFGHLIVYTAASNAQPSNYQFFKLEKQVNTLPGKAISSTIVADSGYAYITYKNKNASVIVIPDATTVFTTTADTSVAPTRLSINGLAISNNIKCQTVFLSGDIIYALLSNGRLYYAQKSDPTQFSPVNVDPNHYTIYAITSNGDGTVFFSGADKNANTQIIGKLNTSGIMGKPTETPNAVKILVPMH